MSMAISGMGSINSMLDKTTSADNSQKAGSLKSAVNGLSSESTEEELKEVLKDFESYFIEQMIKNMKDTFTHKDEEDSTMSQYSDMFMDTAIEQIADVMLDEIGDSITQQLFEQMKRNYNIPTADTATTE